MDKKISDLASAASIDAADVSLLVHNNTDYQFTFATLLSFLSSNLSTGAAISFGTTLPQNTTGKNGDVFVNTTSGAFAQKISGTWNVVYTLPSGSNQTDGTVLYGLGAPASSTGNNADTYINTTTGIFYKKTAGTWNQVFTMLNGPAGAKGDKGDTGNTGAAGRTILQGASNPSNSTDGANGDFYINTSTYTLFGPKTAGVWGSGTTLIGPQGEKGDTGDTGPVGAKGDKGDTGDTGPQGIPGEKGDTGSAGDAGAKGDTGDTGPQGEPGEKGDAGDAGPAGPGVPVGGTAGQILAKVDEVDRNTIWIDVPAGVVKANSTELDAGTEDTKFATALGLENSKYLTQSGTKLSATASGTNAYAATISPAITAYTNTQRFYIRFTNANTSLSCTLTLNGLSALPLVKGINTALAVGDIAADSIHLLAIDGTNARILSLSSIPTITSGEKVLTITSGGPQKIYDLQELTVSPTALSSADFSTGVASITGLIGQVSYDSNYRYDCIGINQWRRSALNGNLVDLYLADIDDSAGDKTSVNLQTAYPSSLIGQQVWGLNNLYIKKTTTSWRKIAITTA